MIYKIQISSTSKSEFSYNKKIIITQCKDVSYVTHIRHIYKKIIRQGQRIITTKKLEFELNGSIDRETLLYFIQHLKDIGCSSETDVKVEYSERDNNNIVESMIYKYNSLKEVSLDKNKNKKHRQNLNKYSTQIIYKKLSE